MMRDGDILGILDILISTQKYDYDIFQVAVFLQTDIDSVRVVTFLSHVPWLGAAVLSYPNLLPTYTKFRAYARERAMQRIKRGSPYKDLFHHLVRYTCLFCLPEH